MTVKWRGKPVFIKYRTEEDIAAQAATPLSDLKDPQRDIDRVLDPKVRFDSVGASLDHGRQGSEQLFGGDGCAQAANATMRTVGDACAGDM